MSEKDRRQLKLAANTGYGCLGCFTLMTLPLQPIFFLADLPQRARHRFRKRAFQTGHTISEPPFPVLTWSDIDCWEGHWRVPEWGGLQSQGVDLVVQSLDPASNALPSDAQKQAFGFLCDNASAIFDQVFDEIFAHLKDAQGRGLLEIESDVAELTKPSQLHDQFELHGLHIHRESIDAMSHIGLEFSSKFDEEHGLGVLMHGSRVVEVGGADSAF